jgi:hypothetical protein
VVHRANLLLLGVLACSKPLSGDECEAFKHKLRVLDYQDTGRSQDLAADEQKLLSSPGYRKSTSCPQVSRPYFECAMRASIMAELAKCKR